MLLTANQCCLILIDMQERLAPAIHEGDKAVANGVILMKAATRLEVPQVVTRQYPKGLGDSVPDIAALTPQGAVFDKTHFACTQEPGFTQQVNGLGREKIVVAGMEAHVCVLQTVLGLRSEGKDVYVVADAISSRTQANKEAALVRMRDAGAHLVTTEMVVFEWLEKAGTPEFKELSALIK
ncbi:MAG: hydrolase [Rhodospirillales bacterium]|nr:hydrolase [Rhodospirillales bacterium]